MSVAVEAARAAIARRTRSKPGSGNGKKEARRSIGRTSNRDVVLELVHEIRELKRFTRALREADNQRWSLASKILDALRDLGRDIQLANRPSAPALTPQEVTAIACQAAEEAARLSAENIVNIVELTVHATLKAAGIRPRD